MPSGVYEHKSLEPHVLAQRFFDNTERIPECGCWIWMGFVGHNGYGQYGSKGKTLAAHRVAFELTNGSIPRGMHVRHTCNIQTCVNPAHLALGTHTDNMRDRSTSGKYGGQFCGAKFSLDIVQQIRDRYIPRKYGCRKLSKDFGVSVSQVKNIVSYRQRCIR